MFHQYGVEITIEKLRPGARFSLMNYDIIGWEDPENREPPTRDEIEKQMEIDKKLHDYYLYQQLRFREFPEGWQQLEMLWDDMDQDRIPGKESSIWYKTIKEVKDKYPKPTEPLEI